MKYNLEPQQMPVIAIDFDGCIVEDKWPEIGDPIPGAIETINQWFDDSFWIIINSCRDGDRELDMIQWLIDHNVAHHEINDNLEWRILEYGTDPRKIGADIYIDDHNIENYDGPIDKYDWRQYQHNVDAYTKNREARLCID